MKEIDIIQTAIENLHKATGIHATWKEDAKGFFDGALTIKMNGKKLTFNADVKQELRLHQINNILNRIGADKPIIIIATRIFPNIKEHLREQQVAYLETNGNIFIKQDDIFIWIDGNKPLREGREILNRAFTKTGIRTIFYFLLDENLINTTHRNIAEVAGVGLGNTIYVINGLKDLGLIAKLNKNEYTFTDQKKLLEKWMEAYDQKLKPDLEIGTFKFIKNDDFYKWKEIQFKKNTTLWGGEPAGDLLTNYLQPETLTIYTNETRAELMKNYRFIPDPGGNIKVYNRFWAIEQKNINTTPPLLVYADLLNTGDKRCIETANLVYDKYLKNRFR
jgi:hypothetical protein